MWCGVVLRHHRGTDDQLPSGRSTTVTSSAYFTLLSICPGKTDRQESVTGHILAVGATSQSVAPYEFVIAFARECPAWNNNERRQCLSTIHLPFGGGCFGQRPLLTTAGSQRMAVYNNSAEYLIHQLSLTSPFLSRFR